MSRSIVLAPYVITARAAGERGAESQILSDMESPQRDLYEILKAYLRDRQDNKVIDRIQKRSSRVREYQATDARRHVDGRFSLGDYGYATDIEDIDTDEQHRRKVTDCEYYPLFFDAYTPANKRKALILMQRNGQLGCKSQLEDDLRKFIHHRVDPNLNIRLSHYMDRDYLEKIVRGRIKAIKYIKNTVPEDLASDIFPEARESRGCLELKVRIRERDWIRIPRWIDRVFSRGWGEADTRTFEIAGIEYDEVRVEFQYENKKKSVALSKLDRLTLDLDVSEDLEYGEDGHPTIESLREAARPIARGILTKMGLVRYDG